MNPETMRIFDKLLDKQSELISAIGSVTTADQLEALRVIAEAQFNITEALMPVITIPMPDEVGSMTMQ